MVDLCPPALDADIDRLMELANAVAIRMGKECTADGTVCFERAFSEGSDITLEIVIWPRPEIRLFAADLHGQVYVISKVGPSRN